MSKIIECSNCLEETVESELSTCNDCGTEICSRCETVNGLCEDCEAALEDEDDE